MTKYADMFEITKILSMFMKSSHIITEREKFLQNKVDNDDYGVFTLSKFEEEVGRITRNAHVTNKKIGFVYFNFTVSDSTRPMDSCMTRSALLS